MKNWYWRHKSALCFAFFGAYILLMLALAVNAVAARPATATSPGATVTYAQQYANSLCYAIQHQSKISKGFTVSDFKCRPNGLAISGNQLFYLDVTVKHSTWIRRYEYIIDQTGQFANKGKILWSHSSSLTA